ncbi:MAG: hypothetical protein ABR875_02095 [Minisyncoccia bacterium]
MRSGAISYRRQGVVLISVLVLSFVVIFLSFSDAQARTCSINNVHPTFLYGDGTQTAPFAADGYRAKIGSVDYSYQPPLCGNSGIISITPSDRTYVPGVNINVTHSLKGSVDSPDWIYISVQRDVPPGNYPVSFDSVVNVGGGMCQIDTYNGPCDGFGFTIMGNSLVVAISPAGGGTVTGGHDIHCPSNCTDEDSELISGWGNGTGYSTAESVTLTATPNTGYAFDHWSGVPNTGDCNGSTTTTCNMPMSISRSVTAVFRATSNPKPKVDLSSIMSYFSYPTKDLGNNSVSVTNDGDAGSLLNYSYGKYGHLASRFEFKDASDQNNNYSWLDKIKNILINIADATVNLHDGLLGDGGVPLAKDVWRAGWYDGSFSDNDIAGLHRGDNPVAVITETCETVGGCLGSQTASHSIIYNIPDPYIKINGKLYETISATSGQQLNIVISSGNLNTTTPTVVPSTTGYTDLSGICYGLNGHCIFNAPASTTIYEIRVKGVSNDDYATDSGNFVSAFLTVNIGQPPSGCLPGAVSLSGYSIPVGDSVTASIPSGWSGSGAFISSDATVASVGPTSGVVTGNKVGSASISGTGWTDPSGKTNCPLDNSNVLSIGPPPSSPPPPSGAVSVSLTADPDTVDYGHSSTLTWVPTNATSCTSTNLPAGNWSTGDSGSVFTGSLTGTTTYYITCTGSDGTANATATVDVRLPSSVLAANLTIKDDDQNVINVAIVNSYVNLYVDASADTGQHITNVKFCSDDTPGDHSCDSSWTNVYDWTISNNGFGIPWNAVYKRMKWSFATPGIKGVYVRVQENGGTWSSIAEADITINDTFWKLHVYKNGSGDGTVQLNWDDSIFDTLTCGSDTSWSDCNAGTRQVNRSSVYVLAADVTTQLHASPATGSTFAGWSGSGCSGTGGCAVTPAGDANGYLYPGSPDNSVTATFNTLATPTPPPGNSNPNTPSSVAAPGSVDYCAGLAASVNWTYSDTDNNPVGTDPQSAYDVNILASGFSFDTGKVMSSGNSYSIDPSKLAPATTYSAKVKVWDSHNAASPWSSVVSWTTPPYHYPGPADFTPTPANITHANTSTQFTDKTNYYSGGTPSQLWTFANLSTGAPATTFTSATPTFSFPTAGLWSVSLVASKGTYACSSGTCNAVCTPKDIFVNVGNVPVPSWIEVPPAK